MLSLLVLQSETLGALADVTVDQTLLIMLSVLALVSLIVLGLRFLRNMFEVITAPTASLKYHGEADNFFFSLMMVFLGGLIGTIILIASSPALVSAYTDYSSTVAADMAAGNSNQVYRGIAQTEAEARMNNNFDLYVMKNLIMLPMVFILLWLFIGSFTFLFAKIFGGQASWIDVNGAIAYSGFFWALGLCMLLPGIVSFVSSQVGGPGPDLGVIGIIGAVLLFYALILFVLGANQVAEMTAGQTLGVLIGLAVILFGLYYWINDTATIQFGEFRTRIQTFDPSRG